jgi:hypothetical protein
LKHSEKSSFRPPLLSALCVLTFIGSSIGFTGYFLAALFFEKASELIIEFSAWHTVNAISSLYLTLIMVAFAVSLIGAIRMWKLHRDGFLIYTLAQLAILFIPVFWVNWNSFSVTNAIFTSIFIAGYGLNLKWMH